MSINEPVFRTSNWRELDHSEKFDAVRDSPSLVRGTILSDVEVDCRDYWIKDGGAHFELKFYRPTSELGSYAFVRGHEYSVRGRLDIIGSSAPPYQRIYVLGEATTSDGSKSVPRSLDAEELRYIASLLTTYDNSCDSPSGYPIETFVLLAPWKL